MSSRLSLIKYKQIRWYSSKQKMKVIEKIDKLLSNNELQHKQHPGLMRPKQVEQPSWLINAVRQILHEKNISSKVIYPTSQKLAAHLYGRYPPQEKQDILSKLKEVQSKMSEGGIEDIGDIDLLRNSKARKIFKCHVYHWKPIEYDEFTSLAYLVGRGIPEYTVLYRIFQEIVNNDKNFKPKTLFDYGSGVGTVIWAASQFWVDYIKEYYCVDISKEMNTLSEYITQYITPKIKPQFISYRQFLPASPIATYDIVVSAYSLLELPNQKCRLEVISKLWQKTEQYLIIIEQGTKAGFEIVNEARDLILNYQNNACNAHVVSPCPHDLKCPMYMTDDSLCNFQICYLTLPISNKSKYKQEFYSYVVLKKGERLENDCKWPRIVKPVLRRSAHVICRMCTASGEFQEQIFTTWKNGKNTYRCARKSDWGDRLPFQVEETKNTEEPE